MIKKFLALVVVFLLAGCGSMLSVDTINNPPPTYNPTAPAEISMKNIHWQVINNAQLQALAKTNNTDLVIFALSPDDFKSLLLNLQDTDRFIEEDSSMIVYYRGTNSPLGTTTTGQ